MLDEIAGELIDEAAQTDGVHMHYGDEIDEFVRDNGVVKKVRLKSGTEIEAQCYGIGLGLTLNTDLLEGAGVETSKNGILCDDRLETNVKGIFAAGDIADFYDPILEMRYRMGTWNNAGAHGKVAAQNMMGNNVPYDDVPEYSSLLFKGQTITQFGLSPEYRADIETVFTVDREKKWYRALYFWDHRLVGGCFMGKGNRSGKRKYLDTIKGKQRFPKDEWKAMLEWTHD
jgi:NAD(P)H-nitrite reductase large subunit